MICHNNTKRGGGESRNSEQFWEWLWMVFGEGEYFCDLVNVHIYEQ